MGKKKIKILKIKDRRVWKRGIIIADYVANVSDRKRAQEMAPHLCEIVNGLEVQ